MRKFIFVSRTSLFVFVFSLAVMALFTGCTEYGRAFARSLGEDAVRGVIHETIRKEINPDEIHLHFQNGG